MALHSFSTRVQHYNTVRGAFSWIRDEVRTEARHQARDERESVMTMDCTTTQLSPAESDSTLNSSLWDAEAGTLVGEEGPPRSPSPPDSDAEGDYSDTYPVCVVEYDDRDGVELAVAIRKWRRHCDLDAGGGIVSVGDLFRLQDHEGRKCVVQQPNIAYEALQGWRVSRLCAAIDSVNLAKVGGIISTVEVGHEEERFSSGAWALRVMETLDSEGCFVEVYSDDDVAID